MTVRKAGPGEKNGRKVTWLMDAFTEAQLQELRQFWGNINQTRTIEIAIDKLHDDMVARKARGEVLAVAKNG